MSKHRLTAPDKERVSWLVNAGQDDTVRGLRAMTGTAEDVAVLKEAIAKEKAHLARPSRLKPMEARLRGFAKSAAPLAAC